MPERMTPFWEADYTQLRQHALLALDPAPNGQWHWAVWDAVRKKIIDPLKRPAKHPIVVGHIVVEGRPPTRCIVKTAEVVADRCMHESAS